MKTHAKGEHAVVAVPPVLDPVEVRIPVVGIAVQDGNARIAVLVEPDQIYRITPSTLSVEYSPD